MITRRVWLARVAATAATGSAFAAPPNRISRVAILNAGAQGDPRVEALKDELRSLGYIEARNMVLDYRWADGRRERLPELAAAIVTAAPDVAVAMGPTAWALKQHSTTLPIVFAYSGDPVGTGLVANLAHPGSNLTGLSFMSSDLAAKRLELLKLLLPRAARVALLYNLDERATAPELQDTEAAAARLGLSLQRLDARSAEDLPPLFAAASRERADALIVFTHGFALQHRAQIIGLAARHRLPAVYGWREFAEAGGLMSYGPDIDAMIRRAGRYVDRILNGARPGDLPVEQPTRLELVLNLKTAKATALQVPAPVLLRADTVIE